MNGRQYIVDPHDLETRFSDENGMAFLDSIFTEPSEEAVTRMHDVREVIDMLPPMEADFIEMYYFLGCKQTDIADIFLVSQPTVCYRLRRAAARIKYLLETPKITKEGLIEDVLPILQSEQDIDILWLMYRTTCQSSVAVRLDVSQGLIRHRFLRAMREIQGHEHLSLYVDAFNAVMKNLNILRDMTNSGLDDVEQILLVV